MSIYDNLQIYTQKDFDDLCIKHECELRQLRDRLVSYEHDLKLLRALEAAGVDNWEGYDEAIEILKGGKV